VALLAEARDSELATEKHFTRAWITSDVASCLGDHGVGKLGRGETEPCWRSSLKTLDRGEQHGND
jgi:hypothetical protein